MASSINASTSGAGGVITTADNTGTLNIQSAGSTVLALTSSGTTVTGTGSFSGNLSFNSGYGSAAVAYGCRAWVNFNGTGTVAIRASGNVSSITDNGAGDYTVNFTNAMPDANYNIVACTSDYNNDANRGVMGAVLRTSGSSGYPTTSNFKIYMRLGASSVSNGANWDEEIICLSVFR